MQTTSIAESYVNIKGYAPATKVLKRYASGWRRIGHNVQYRNISRHINMKTVLLHPTSVRVKWCKTGQSGINSANDGLREEMGVYKQKTRTQVVPKYTSV